MGTQTARDQWQAGFEAQVAKGAMCSACGAWIVQLRVPGRLALCHYCKQIGEARELVHPSYLRCPKCRHAWEAYAGDLGILDEGSHTVSCPECEYDFQIETRVLYTFLSPEMLKGEGG